VLIDGVKLIDDEGWSLVVPDPEEPLTLVTVEAASLAAAETRAQAMADEIGAILAAAGS
jgi:phosphomannomutase